MRTVTVTHGEDCFRFRIPAEKDWGDLADYLRQKARPGTVIALSGPLGAGKTTLVQALAASYGIKKTPPSPTFALLRSYPIRKRGAVKRLLHVDAYRIEAAREMRALDLDEELADGNTVLVLEWPEHVAAWLGTRHDAIRVEIVV